MIRGKFVLYNSFFLSHVFFTLSMCVMLKATLGRWCHPWDWKHDEESLYLDYEAQECLWHRPPFVCPFWSEKKQKLARKKVLLPPMNWEIKTNLLTCRWNTKCVPVTLQVWCCPFKPCRAALHTEEPAYDKASGKCRLETPKQVSWSTNRWNKTCHN